MTIFKYKYCDPSDLTKYKICEFVDGIEQREVSESYYLFQDMLHSYTPEKISGNRFISIVDGVPVVDPDMNSILAKEQQAIKDEQIRQQLRELDWKVLRYIEQTDLVKKGRLSKNKLSESEYEALLIERQQLRDSVSDTGLDTITGE